MKPSLRHLCVLALLAVVSLVYGSTVSQAAKRPPGAVKVQQKSVGKVSCGLINKTFVPGRKLSGGYFVSYTKLAATAKKKAGAKKLSRKAKKKLLKQAKKYKQLAKAQKATCKKLNGTGTGPTPTPTPVPTQGPTGAGNGKPLKFGLAGAVGVALQGQATTRQATTEGSNLDAVTAAGTTTDAVVSGTATIDKILVAPNNKLYAILNSKTDLDGSAGTAPACLLAEVDTATGVPTCIDSELSQIDTRATITGGGVSTYKNPPVQFDSKGSIIYVGRKADGKTVLRKFLDGTTTDLVTDNVSVLDFVVEPDDSVLLSGSTSSTGQVFTRRVKPTGGLETIKNDSAFFMYPFPDQKTYMGFNLVGIQRYTLPSAYGTPGSPGTLEAKPWTADASRAQTGGFPAPYFDTGVYCPGQANPSPAGLSACGGAAFTTQLFTTTDDNVFGIVQGNIGNAKPTLFKYYPAFELQPTAVKDVRVAQGVITNLLLSGLNESGQNVTTVVNTSSGAEKTLIGADNEIEVYHLNYVANGNKVLFDGLRFSDNKYVIGQVSLNGGAVTATAVANKLSDLQSFD